MVQTCDNATELGPDGGGGGGGDAGEGQMSAVLIFSKVSAEECKTRVIVGQSNSHGQQNLCHRHSPYKRQVYVIEGFRQGYRIIQNWTTSRAK